MTTTVTKKSPAKSANMWTGIATIAAAIFSYFAINPDLSAAATLGDEAHKAVDAISTRNYVLLFSVVVNAGNILYHLFVKKN